MKKPSNNSISGMQFNNWTKLFAKINKEYLSMKKTSNKSNSGAQKKQSKLEIAIQTKFRENMRYLLSKWDIFG